MINGDFGHALAQLTRLALVVFPDFFICSILIDSLFNSFFRLLLLSFLIAEEMAEEEFKHCRSWEEDMYWNHFQCHRFSQILHPGFDRHLAIPEQFTKNLREKLPKLISLKGPSGSVWPVDVTTINGTIFFCDGWDEFVNDNLLQENDLLIFKYNGASCFDVLMFDGQSLCEKAASYFVRKCGHRDQDSDSRPKRKIGENSAGATVPPNGEFNGVPTPEKSPNTNTYTAPFRKTISSRATTKKIRRPIEEINPSPMDEEIYPAIHVDEDVLLPVHQGFSAYDEEIEIDSDIEFIGTRVAHDVPYISSKSPVIEEDKMNALQLAQEAITSNGFLTVMKPTYVSRKFFMSIPSNWMVKQAFSLETQDIILRKDDKMWPAKYYYQKSRNSGGLSTGWKKFAVDNNLQEHDVCVFEPGSRIDNVIVLDVCIFHVQGESL